MRIKITAPIVDGLKVGSILDVGENIPRDWAGGYVVLDELDHDGDGKKGGVRKPEKD